ncbi:MAG: alpha/beta hydrolase [Gemella sp.]|nr:alpha/beta hydrolase [Gemella sp.]
MIVSKVIFIFIFIKLIEKLEKKSLSAIILQSILDYRKYKLSKKVDPYKGKETFLSRKYKYLMDNPEKTISYPVKEKFYDDMQVYTINDNGDKNQKVLIYFYGSAYYRQITSLHLKNLKRIIDKTNVKIILPNYHKAYDHTFKQVYDKVHKMYEDVIKDNSISNIYMAGDSSGGGLALGFAKYLRDIRVELPQEIFLFSPWLDVSFKNEQYKKYEKYEAYLDVKRLRDIGECWAGGKEYVTSAYASPIYGDLRNLPPLHIFTGTNEIFYPDVRKLHKELKKVNIKHYYSAKKNMIHAYNVFPIREAKSVINYVAKKIKDIK